ncbi:F-box/FBD/LRR-repeat protein At1g13570-like [Apium graveolens]|uniref:F-box/FBD/LRR-repeat protein At1g13570-like n=1 Tax=Apium graveolens TaxID=4045 RepID=UPI003D78C52A
MGKCSRVDIVNDLPGSIIESILTKLPARDAVRTSILSPKWRYHWTTMTQLTFDDQWVTRSEENAEKDLVNFIMRFLLRHDGPIHKFKLHTEHLKRLTELEQWLLFLLRKNLNELDLSIYRDRWIVKGQRFYTPPCIFSYQKLTKLKLFGFELKPPIGFQGFPCLKYLKLHGGTVAAETIENLITGCPLLEKFKFTNLFDPLALTLCAPNLKHLGLYSGFEDVYLKHTPVLVAIKIYFTWFWKGNIRIKDPVTYDCLKLIVLECLNFEEIKEVLYALHLILQSPNLQELRIVTSAPQYEYEKAADVDFWEKKCPADFTFKHLKIVEMSDLSKTNDT